MVEAYYLTESDRAILKKVVERERKRSGNQQNLPDSAAPGDADTAPDVYVAYTGTGGIPARVGTTLGVAELTLYKRLNPAASPPTLVSLGLTQRVHNLSTDVVDLGQYVLVSRAKDGTWYVSSTAGGTGNIDTGTAGCGAQSFYTYRYACELQDAMGAGTADDIYALNEYRTLHILTTDDNGCLVHMTMPDPVPTAVACCDPSCVVEDTGTGTSGGGVIDTGTGTGQLTTGCCPDGINGTLNVDGSFLDAFFGQTCNCADFSFTITYGHTTILNFPSAGATVWAGAVSLACGLTLYIEFTCTTFEGNPAWAGIMALYLTANYPAGPACYTAPSPTYNTNFVCDPLEVDLSLGFTEDLTDSCGAVCDLPSAKIGVNVTIGE